MNARQYLAYHGNLNRIAEMYAGGCGAHGISGAFRDHGIEVSPVQAQAFIDSIPALMSKALPRKVATAQIQADNLVPAT